MKFATTTNEQINLLRDRGMLIANVDKAAEILSDIGYYRLGFYWFPFENKDHGNRKHNFKQGTKFESAVDLYYFDHDMRKILLPYIQRVEVNFRTRLIYYISNQYKNDPIWFSNTAFVSKKFVANLNSIYSDIKKNPIIQKHHKKYPKDIFAPAWKTLEYATLGNITALYKAINDSHQREAIASFYNVSNLKVFDSYLTTLKYLRNICAHGHTLFDTSLSQSIRKGTIKLVGEDFHNIVGAIKVLDYFLRNISSNRAKDLEKELLDILQTAQKKEIYPLVSYISGIK